jgi:hypothetical protein
LLDSSPPDQARASRPLRTGKSFLLVVPSRRVVVRRWDKDEYQPGEECRLSIHGEGLGKDPLSVTVESENEDGTWTAVARLEAEVAEGEDQALVSWRLPERPVVPGEASVQEADGSQLTDARFEDHRDLEGGAVWMRAQAEGFEGKSVQVVLERESEPGQWTPIGQAVTTVRSGALRTSVMLEGGADSQAKDDDASPIDPEGEKPVESSSLSDARFEDHRDLEGGAVWMRAQAEGLEGRSVQVLLEREGASGEWLTIGEAVATVRSGALRTSVDLDAGTDR